MIDTGLEKLVLNKNKIENPVNSDATSVNSFLNNKEK
jgi:hypothetical protein